jgi:glycosyltransferase involved in cell wall biosynthesis
MSGHLPVIASNVPAMLPLIEGAAGLAITPKDVPSLVAALDNYLALSDDELKAKGEQAFHYLQKEHDIEVFRQEYLDLIDSGLEQARKEQK